MLLMIANANSATLAPSLGIAPVVLAVAWFARPWLPRGMASGLAFAGFAGAGLSWASEQPNAITVAGHVLSAATVACFVVARLVRNRGDIWQVFAAACAAATLGLAWANPGWSAAYDWAALLLLAIVAVVLLRKPHTEGRPGVESGGTRGQPGGTGVSPVNVRAGRPHHPIDEADDQAIQSAGSAQRMSEPATTTPEKSEPANTGSPTAALTSGLAAVGLVVAGVAVWLRGAGLEEVVATLPLIGTGLAALVLVVALIVADWWMRRRMWLADPTRPIDRPPPHRWLHAGAIVLGLLVATGAAARAGWWSAALASLLASCAILTAGHTLRWLWASALGMGVLGLGVGLVLVAGGLDRPMAVLLAVAAASGYELWLARFWAQQLHAGGAWTTAGRLVPIARNLSRGGVFVLAGCALRAALRGGSDESLAVLALTTAGVLLLARMHWRDATGDGSCWSAAAACVALASAAVPLQRLVPLASGWSADLVLLVAAGSLVLGWAGRFGAGRVCTPMLSAYIGGLVPVIVAYTLAVRGLDLPRLVAAVVATAGVWVVIGAGGRRRRTGSADGVEPSAPVRGVR